MQRKKCREKKLREERLERNETSKKTLYHEMHASNELGNKELENYRIMYNDLSEEYQKNFKNPENKPNAIDYKSIKKFYYSKSVSSIESKV
jgi:hypothetical protein